MSKSSVAIITSSVLAVFLIIWLVRNESSQKRAILGSNSASSAVLPSDSRATDVEIHLACAASNQAVIEEIRRAYEAETGRKVVVQYGNSQSLLSQIELSKVGDLFLPADDSYLQIARDKGLIDEEIPIASMQAGLVVKEGNPHSVTSLDSLLKKPLRFVQASPDATAIGKLTKEKLEKAGTWQAIAEATTAYRGTVTEVINDVRIDAADVGIVFDAVLHSSSNVQFLQVPELEDVKSEIGVGLINTTANPTAALHFARYIAARDRGQTIYEKHGFKTTPGDRWQDIPELTVYAGSMLRPAIEDTIIEFEKREGVQVSRSYNGCGILVSQMKSGQHPDAYFACDLEFMTQVQDLFSDATSVSQNELVILVPKGNPNKIGSLRDLTKPGLRVGIGHEKQCAMGWITQNTFRESGMQSEIMENVTVQTPTGDMLVNQLRTESLDAAVAYLSNAAGSADFLDAIEIRGIPCSIATQPWAISKDTSQSQLANRLFQKIQSTESRDIFEAEGFRWKAEQEPLNHQSDAP